MMVLVGRSRGRNIVAAERRSFQGDYRLVWRELEFEI